MKDKVFFTEKIVERKAFDVYFTDTMRVDSAPPEYYVKVIESEDSWQCFLAHKECPYLQLMTYCPKKGNTAEQIIQDIQGFINDEGDRYIGYYESKFLGN